MERVVAQSLGSSSALGLDLGFDAERARGSLRFYDGASIPSVPAPVPEGVSNVRFDADLEQVEPLDVARLESLGLLHSASIPTVA